MPQKIRVVIIAAVIILPLQWWAMRHWNTFQEQHFPAGWRAVSSFALLAFFPLWLWQGTTRREWLKTFLGLINLVLILGGVVWPFFRYGFR